MKSSKRSLLTLVILAIFVFSCMALDFKKNIACSEKPSKSRITIADVHILDPPPALSRMRTM